jgi:hypothetical protein
LDCGKDGKGVDDCMSWAVATRVRVAESGSRDAIADAAAAASYLIVGGSR